MLIVTPEIGIEEGELEELFVRASGPGGQNVNKVATAVQLRFDVVHSQGLPEAVRERLRRLNGKRISAEGILTIEARRFRTQEQNREDARERLVKLIREAADLPRARRTTKPTRASKERRIEGKKVRGQIKTLRGKSFDLRD